jgi:mono/diheme cytochrome c family protein
MSWVGRACAVGAVVGAVVTVAAWDSGSPVSRERPLDGADVFSAKGCASCHDGPDSSASGGAFPSLRDAAAWAGGRRPGMTSQAYLAQSMQEPSAFISPAFRGDGPLDAMPNLALTSDEVDALVEYLLSG